MTSVYIYTPYAYISESLCLEFFKTCEQLQDPNTDFGVHYLDIMKEMHISFNRLERVLKSIFYNWAYFKLHYGYTYHGWNVNVDMHKPIVVDRKPILYLRVTNYNIKED